MLHHGDVQSRIQNEVDLVIGPDRSPSLSDRAAMPYTEAAILETLRFGPVISLAVPHTVNEDVTFRGYSIANGTTVSNYMHTFTHTLTLIHTDTHSYTHTLTYLHTHTHTHTHSHRHTRTHTHTHTHTNTHTQSQAEGILGCCSNSRSTDHRSG
jgi:hypothetical protein